MALADMALKALQDAATSVASPSAEEVVSPRKIALREAWAAMQAKDAGAFEEAFNNAIEIALAERE